MVQNFTLKALIGLFILGPRCRDSQRLRRGLGSQFSFELRARHLTKFFAIITFIVGASALITVALATAGMFVAGDGSPSIGVLVFAIIGIATIPFGRWLWGLR